eukprot:TRINITY_DN47335_c0_g1_i1.p1 TRINITY_DN47335_c0_g1~~TRINITY_DN47335_c0_g1_i1.p1  ORF type:complete len:118 (+),score=15.90 TRINITY_DN47335_c0_g1_i1:41-355(+)
MLRSLVGSEMCIRDRTEVDLSPLWRLTHIDYAFLQGCSGLATLDLSPLSHVTSVEGSFLLGCTGLTSLDLTPLSKLETISWHFVSRCISPVSYTHLTLPTKRIV